VAGQTGQHKNIEIIDQGKSEKCIENEYEVAIKMNMNDENIPRNCQSDEKVSHKTEITSERLVTEENDRSSTCHLSSKSEKSEILESEISESEILEKWEENDRSSTCHLSSKWETPVRKLIINRRIVQNNLKKFDDQNGQYDSKTKIKTDKKCFDKKSSQKKIKRSKISVTSPKLNVKRSPKSGQKNKNDKKKSNDKKDKDDDKMMAKSCRSQLLRSLRK